MAVRMDVQDGIAVITMDDGKANAINSPVIDEWNAVLDGVEADKSVKALIITGRPGKFSAGFDLRYFMGHTMEENQALVHSGGLVAQRIFRLPIPVVAAVSGHAIAMGVFLVLACDRRIGIHGDYKIGANETVNGMVIPRFAMALLKHRLKPNHLDAAALMGRLYTPTDAVEVGYLDAVVEPEHLMDTAMQSARNLGEFSPDAYGGNKHLAREAVYAEMAEGLDV